MTAIKIKDNNAKLADGQQPAAAAKSTAGTISSGDDASNPPNDRGRNTSNANNGSSSNGTSKSPSDDKAIGGDEIAVAASSSAKAGGGGNDDAPADADSNDNVGLSGNDEDVDNANAKDEEDVEESGGAGDNEGNDTEEGDKEGNEEEEGKNEEEEEEEEEEMWELKKVMTVDEIKRATPIMCNGNACPNVACSVYQSTLDTNCTDAWFTCVDCQESDYGGWPETKTEMPMTFMTNKHRETIRQYCTRNPDNVDFPEYLPTSRNGEKEEEEDFSDEEEEAGDEKWDLIEVIDEKSLKKKKPKSCDEEECQSAACSVWASNHEPDNHWHGCIDCMETYYGGWPSASEMPVRHLTDDHRTLLAEKCSEREDPPMPDLPNMPLLATAGGDSANNITPLPSHEQSVANNQAELVVGAFRSKGKKSSITPSPMPPKAASKQAAKKAAKLDPALAAKHAKWKAEAVKMGGGNEVIIIKEKAKKVIFDKLHDMFAPANITQLYQKLKGVVPQPVLRSCLDDMVEKSNSNPFAEDSDDDEDEKKSSKKKSASNKSSDEWAGSIRLKPGRNANNTLYFVDHTKLANNGNGLLPEDKNQLYSNLEKSKQEHEVLVQKHKQISANTSQLLSEPKNEALESELHELTNKMEVVDKSLEEARAHAANAKYAKQLKGKIDSMASHWRKRKRITTEFILRMEDATDGTINMKKIAKGDGPIEIETDEAAIKGAMAWGSRKKAKIVSKPKGGLKPRNGASAPSAALVGDENLIGVTLDAKGVPQRVFLNEKEEEE